MKGSVTASGTLETSSLNCFKNNERGAQASEEQGAAKGKYSGQWEKAGSNIFRQNAQKSTTPKSRNSRQRRVFENQYAQPRIKAGRRGFNIRVSTVNEMIAL